MSNFDQAQQTSVRSQGDSCHTSDRGNGKVSD